MTLDSTRWQESSAHHLLSWPPSERVTKLRLGRRLCGSTLALYSRLIPHRLGGHPLFEDRDEAQTFVRRREIEQPRVARLVPLEAPASMS